MLTVEKIATIGIFAEVPQDKLDKFAAIGEFCDVRAGERIFRLGERADYLYVLDDGKVDLTFMLEISETHKEVTVETMESGSTLAWSSLVKPYVLTLSARAVQDSRLIRFPGKDLREIIREEPDVGIQVLNSLCELVGHRLQRFQAMWLIEIQRSVAGRHQ